VKASFPAGKTAVMKSKSPIPFSKKLIFILIAIVVGLFLIDNIFWLIGYRNLSPIFQDRIRLRKFDKIYGSSLKPNAVVDDCRINNQGYREDHDIPLIRPDNERVRGLALGDSIVFGAKVKNEETFCCRLEALIDAQLSSGRSEIINTAVMWWGPSQFLIRYLTEGEKFKPDFVLAGLCPNDVTDVFNFEKMISSKSIVEYDFNRHQVAGESLEGDSATGRALYLAINFCVTHSSFCNALYDFSAGREMRRMERERKQTLDSMPVHDLMQPYLNKMNELMKAITEPKFCILFPSVNLMNDVRDDTYFPYEKEYRKETLDLLEAQSIPYIDVKEVYLEYLRCNPSVKSEDFFAGDLHHPSPLGHKLVAEAIFRLLKADKYAGN
jgi:hypothetical protein